jgi:hypothetical protein
MYISAISKQFKLGAETIAIRPSSRQNGWNKTANFHLMDVSLNDFPSLKGMVRPSYVWNYTPFSMALGKTAFHFIGLNAGGELIIGKKFSRLISSSDFEVLVQFGTLHTEYGGMFGTQTPAMSGRALVAELAANEFVVIGFDAHVQFRPVRGRPQRSARFLRVEERSFVDGQWKATRLLNGDETFFGVSLPAQGRILRVKLMSY